jgi:DNA-binding GntR family transcriptional regulator
MTFSQIYLVSLPEQVVEQVRMAIIERGLKPNDHIVENALTKQLGVSRMSLREALILLKRDGLVISHPHWCSFMRTFSISDVEDIFTMRTTVENFAGERIIESLTEADFQQLDHVIETQRQAITASDFKWVRSIDMNFHQFIIEKNYHPMLICNWWQIVAQIAAMLYMCAEAITDYDEFLTVRDHSLIVNA